ncbi:MAG: hypothetical protein RLN89_07010 [Parvibaculum sp.]
MIGALNTATGGMLAASQAFDQEAAKIAKAGANAVEQVTSTAATPPATLPFAPQTASALQSKSAPEPIDDLVTSVVNLKQIETQYAANAKVVETVSRLLGKTLDILA